jgi:beta-propeller repeat-containing protein/centrosomal CEP192-like protein/HYDIN/CFA65/VesB family protein
LKASKVLVASFLLAVLAGLILSLGRSSQDKCLSNEAARTSQTSRAVIAQYDELLLLFEANQGQTSPEVRFLARGNGYTLFLTAKEAVLALAETKRANSKAVAARHLSGLTVVRLALERANRTAKIEGVDRLPATSSYFLGSNPRAWHSGVPNFARVRYRGIYPGVDLIYYGRQRELEYDFIVAPGADPRAIEFHVAGARRTRLDEHGNLLLEAEGGEVQLRRPAIYQELAGGRHEIAGGFTLHGEGTIGFSVAGYDPTLPLVIDPTLVYSTFLGGNSTDQSLGIAIDKSGNAYITGNTASTDFPGAVNGFQPNLRGLQNAFVAKLSSGGKSLSYGAYVGGTGTDGGTSIAVDAGGNAYVAGSTTSQNFPILPDPTKVVQGTHNTFNQVAFVFKLNATGTALIYSTYLGGSGTDIANGIDLDSSGEAYVTGQTSSIDFPTLNTLQPLRGVANAFVAKLKADGSALLFSTFLGGSVTDSGNALKLDTAANPFITGSTSSADFPTITPFQGTLNGPINAFVAKLKTDGSTILYSTYLGGSGSDEGDAIAVDSGGDAFITGTTTSPDFPKLNPFQAALAGDQDAFVTKLNPSGTGLVYSTYLGGSSGDRGFGIAVDSSGNTDVTGQTRSADFPTRKPFQPALQSGANAFVAQLQPDGTALVYSTYLGGSGVDQGRGVVVDSSGNAFVTGSTQSPNFPLVGPEQNFLDGGTDAFIAKISSAPSPGVLLTPAALNFGTIATGVESSPQSSTLTNAGDATLNISSISLTGTNPADFTEKSTCTGSLASGSSCTITSTFKPTVTLSGTLTATISISDNAVGSPHTITLSGMANAPTANVTLFPASLVFSGVAVGQKSPAQIVTLNNAGTAATKIISITFTGTNKGDFSQTNNCGTSLAAAASCQINVFFQPTAAGVRQAELDVNDDAPASPQITTLFGGENFGLAVSPSPITVSAGQTTTTQVSVVPGNGFNQAVALTCTGAPAGATCNLNPASVTLDGTNTAFSTVTITTMARGINLPVRRFQLPGGLPPVAPWLAVFGLALLALVLTACGAAPQMRHRACLGFGAALVLLAISAGCGGGGGGSITRGTPAGQFTLTVTGKAGTLSVKGQFILIVN